MERAGNARLAARSKATSYLNRSTLSVVQQMISEVATVEDLQADYRAGRGMDGTMMKHTASDATPNVDRSGPIAAPPVFT
ncbi:hypothetical protein GCM10010377_49300 [Streptomyces viridiviolaceus]|uniref:Uncharacterized protein n=1 Tax=Streptomyces viridiviolaceus TaxID=68282 RepID=A0ABW2E495_9ACTN|nr:hypothetical protein [Streptomyces viridiviolaceus]GHB52313.1 hypothetical protein GCM10010377_49300 [Streptomyces viridiviolaceus]